jgi:hypothetical protein
MNNSTSSLTTHGVKVTMENGKWKMENGNIIKVEI